MASRSVAPKQEVHGNLHFSPFGVFAYWILTPPDKPLANHSRSAAIALAHRRLTDVLPLRPTFAGTSSLKDPRFIYAQQAKGVDLKAHPLYQEVCLARQLEAEGTEPRFSVNWMWVRLEPNAGGLGSPLSVLNNRLTRIGLYSVKPTPENIDLYWAAMEDVERRIPADFAPLRPTGPQIRWLWRRQQTLGVIDEPCPLPEYSDGAVTGHTWSPRVAIDEGDGTKTGSLQPMMYVTSDDDGHHVSYQIHATVTSFPAGGIYFPGSNFTGLISNVINERTGARVAVDWTQHAHLLPLGTARRRNQTSHRKISEQYDQQAGRRTTQELAESEEALEDFEVELSVHPREAEVVYTTVFSVGAPTAAQARAGFTALRDVLEEPQVQIAAPVGQQRRLYKATRPGVEDRSILSANAQYTSRTGWSRYIPLSASRFGDTEGRAVGINKMTGELDFVFLNTRGEARRVMTGGMIIGGDPRKGKTHFMMLNAAEEAISGGCVVMFDATRRRHWRTFASVVPGSGVINLGEGKFTVDPLITIGGAEGAELLTNELCRITGARGPVAAELRLVVAGRRWSSAAALLDYLSSPQCPDILKPLGRALLSWSTTVAGQALFGRYVPGPRGRPAHGDTTPASDGQTGHHEPLPLLSLNTLGLVVVETQDMDLPTEDDVQAANNGGEQLTESQMIAQSVMALFAIYLRKVFYGRQTRDVIGFDEGWRTVSLKILKDLVFEIFRTGPAANTDVWLTSQKPWLDFANLDEDLARVRVVFGVEDVDEAKRAARWLGVDPDEYPDIPELLSTGLSPQNRVRDAFHRSSAHDVIARDRMGECLIRTGDGEMGWMKSFEMVFPEWEAAADTRPALT